MRLNWIEQPHAWLMYRGYPVPLCRFCGTGSLEAQKAQPETKGAGPCTTLRAIVPVEPEDA